MHDTDNDNQDIPAWAFDDTDLRVVALRNALNDLLEPSPVQREEAIAAAVAVFEEQNAPGTPHTQTRRRARRHAQRHGRHRVRWQALATAACVVVVLSAVAVQDLPDREPQPSSDAGTRNDVAEIEVAGTASAEASDTPAGPAMPSQSSLAVPAVETASPYGAAAEPGAQAVAAPTFAVLDTTILPDRTSAPVWSVSTTKESVVRFAAALGLPAPTKIQGSWLTTEGPRSLSVTSDGLYEYRDASKGSSLTVEQVAAGLGIADTVITDSDESHVEVVVLLDGLLVMGAQSHITVDEQRAVVSASGLLFAAVRGGEYDLIDPANVILGGYYTEASDNPPTPDAATMPVGEVTVSLMIVTGADGSLAAMPAYRYFLYAGDVHDGGSMVAIDSSALR